MKMQIAILLLFSTFARGQISRIDWSYGPDSLQTMDFIQPASPADSFTTTMILIHGGSWIGGDKTGMQGFLDSLRTRFPRYAFLNINYRLIRPGMNQFPVQEQDVSLAIATLLKEQKKLNLSGSLILFGVSAGAHLALQYAYRHDEPKHVKAVIDGFGPTDLMFSKASEAQLNGFAKMMTGKEGAQGRKILYDSSPINFVTVNSPPTLILQGGKDYLVDPGQSRNLYAKLQKQGVPSELVLYPNEGHGWTGSHLTDSYNKIAAFLESQGL